MQPETFYQNVSDEAGLDDLDRAEVISLAVIETICMYLPPEQTRELAAQLPKTLAKAAEEGASQALQNDRGHISVDDFFSQVATRANQSAEDVQVPARAAISQFKQALSRGESTDVVMDAPPELDALLSG